MSSECEWHLTPDLYLHRGKFEYLQLVQQADETCNTILAFYVSRRCWEATLVYLRDVQEAERKRHMTLASNLFRAGVRGRPYTTVTAASIETHRHLTSNIVIFWNEGSGQHEIRVWGIFFLVLKVPGDHMAFPVTVLRRKEATRRDIYIRHFRFALGVLPGDHIQRMCIDSKHESRGTKTRLIGIEGFRFDEEFRPRPHIRVIHKF